MKNQIDQSTPFLAFYDLLRIRGIYSDEEKREKLRRGFRRAMALAAVLVGLLLPQGAVASVLGDLADENGVISPGSHRGLPGESDNPLLENGDLLKIGTNGKGNALFQTDGSWRTTGGELSGGLVYLLANGGISFEGGSFNVEGLVAAAIGKSEFRLGDKLEKSDVTGSISGSAGGDGFRVYVGKTVGASGGTIVATEGMSDGASFTISGSNGGTITFSGDVGSGTLKARTVNFDDGSSTSGSVTAEDGSVQVGDAVAGSRQDEDGNDVETLSFNQNAERSMTQNAGTISASTISGAIDQKAGTINAGSATATLNVGAGSTLGAGNVTAGTVTVGSGSGALTLAGNELSGKTINAGAVTLAGAAGQEYDVSGAISSIATSGGTAGAVTVSKTGTGALSLGSVSANSLSASTGGGAITQTGATTISGGGNVTLNAGAGTIDLSQGVSGAGTLTLASNNGGANAVQVSGGTVSAGTITMGGSAKTLSQSGGNITVSGANFLTESDTLAQSGGSASFVSSAAAVNQSGSGRITATTLSGAVTQTGGTIAGKDGGNLTLSQAITTQNGTLDASGATLQLADGSTVSGTVRADTLAGGDLTQNGGNIAAATISNDKLTQTTGNISGTAANGDLSITKTLDQNGGSINLGSGTLTLGSASTSAGNITAGKIDAGTTTLTQDGAGTITVSGADGITAGTVAQTAGGMIQADKITAAVSQTGAAKLQANGSGLVLEGDVVQNNAGAMIGSTSTGVTVKQAFTQTAGKIEAETLTLDNATTSYQLDGGNNVATLSGSAQAVTIANGNHDLTLKDLSTSADMAVTSAKDVTLDGASVGGAVRVLSASGEVKDTVNQGDTRLEIGRTGRSTVGSVNLVNATGPLTLQGVNATGNVTIKNDAVTQTSSGSPSSGEIKSTGGDIGISAASFTQDGNAISGNNVTIVGTGSAGLTVDGNVTANAGDVLVKSAEGDVKTTNAATLESKTGSVVLQGANVEVNGSTINAKTAGQGVGIQATGGNAMVKTGTAITTPTVVLDASGNAVVETGVSMGAAQASDKDSELFVTAGGNVDVKLTAADRPTENVTIVSGSLADDPNGSTVELASFAYKTEGDIGFTFTGNKLAVESTGGDVNITATGENLTIVDASTMSGGASVSAKNVVDSSDDPVTVAVGSDETSGAQPKGLVAAAEGKSVTLDASGNVTVEGVITSANAPTITMADGKSFTVANHGVVQSLNGDVSVATTGAGTIDVKSGGMVQAANGAVTLTTAGGSIAVAGTVQAAGGAVQIESGDALTVSGAVRDFMNIDGEEKTESGGVTLSSGNGKNVQVSGTVASRGDSKITAAGNLNQTGGSVASDGMIVLTATDGNINQTGGAVTATGAATANAENGSVVLSQAGNDFQSTLAVTAKNAASVRDANALEVSVSGGTTGNVRIQAGTTLAVTSDIDAGGTATLLSGGHMDAQTVKAAGAVQATAASGGETFAGDIEGASVAATATGGALETQKVTAKSGNVTLSGGSVTTGGEVAANGSSSDVSVTATAGAAQMGDAVTAGRDATITATAGANTTAGAVTAARNATIDAGTGEAQVAAVTATAGNAAVIGGAGATVGGNLTAGGNAVVVSDGGAATVTGNIQAANVGLQGATVANNGTVAQGVNQLAIVQTGGAAMTLTDDTIPTGAQNIGIRSAGNLTVTSDHDLVFGNASVSAGGRTVAANGLASTAGTVEATTAGNIASSAITGAAGTTVTAQNGGTINVAGNLGQGGETVVNANGAEVTAGTLASGTLLDVNNAGAVNANIDAGGDAQIQAASLQAGNTAAGGNLTFDTVTGAADVGNLAVGGDMNGTVGGQFTTAGGNVGSIGQQGGFNAPGGATVDGNLNSGPVLANTGAFTVNGALNAGGNAVVLNTAATTLNGGLTGGNVTINAGGPVTGGGALAAGQLNIAAGGNAITLPNVQSANLNQITGGNITLTDTSGQQITIGTINAGGVLDLTLNSAAGTAGGGNLTANGTMTLTVNGPFGTIAAPVVITINGGNPVLNIDGSGIDGSLLHFILNGALDPGDFVVNYLGEGFAIYGSQQAGWQIIGIGPEKQRLLNRALAFSVNTPELKSKQGIFGDPAMLHTRMNVSEARPGANMDMLALKSVDFSETWKDVSEAGGDLAEWTPAVFVDEAPLLPKLEALASEVQLQPEIQPYHGSTGNADAKE